MVTGKQMMQAQELSAECKITMAEALSLIIQSERNEILKQAFVIHSNNEHPTGLEAIALALGYRN